MVSVPVVASSGEFNTPCKKTFHLMEKVLEKNSPFYFAVIGGARATSDPGCGSAATIVQERRAVHVTVGRLKAVWLVTCFLLIVVHFPCLPCLPFLSLACACLLPPCTSCCRWWCFATFGDFGGSFQLWPTSTLLANSPRPTRPKQCTHHCCIQHTLSCVHISSLKMKSGL